MPMKLYVGNLAHQTSDEDLGLLFAQAGGVESVSVVTDCSTGCSRGFGFVEMSSREEGVEAIAQFDGAEFAGRSLTVYESKPPRAAGASVGDLRTSYSHDRMSRW